MIKKTRSLYQNFDLDVGHESDAFNEDISADATTTPNAIEPSKQSLSVYPEKFAA